MSGESSRIGLAAVLRGLWFYLKHPLPYAVVECDPDTEQPLRNAKGKLQRVRSGEAGLLLAKITAFAPGAGYTDPAATEKKMVRDGFRKGDCWFNTGDLVRAQGYMHIQFVDRLGDTFRWKGENVATTEVEGALNTSAQVEQAVVYGVKVPNADGRAGMAALTLAVPLDRFDGKALSDHLQQQLPSYAVPLFLRVRDAHEVTATFKNRKVELKNEGFDLDAVNDPVFWHAGPQQGYQRLDAETLAAIRAGSQRL